LPGTVKNRVSRNYFWYVGSTFTTFFLTPKFAVVR
jgi:hypothetical protein